MAPRAADAIEAAIVGTGLLDLGAPGTCGNAGDGSVRPGACGNAGDARVRSGPLLVLSSPGRDSACLLHVAVRRRGADGVRVLHVDHGLRDESASEAEFVRASAHALGVDVVVRRAGAPPTSGNVHDWARGERARLAAQEAARVGAAAIATAHTRTDLVETALFRLATQPGRRALVAMRPFEPGTCGNAGDGSVPLVRPLLGVTREETMAWCVANGVHWRDDRANSDRRYARARLRHSVTPVLRGLNPRLEDAVARTLAELEEERDALDAIVQQTLPPHADAIRIAELAALPRPIARLVLRELCERRAGVPCARAGRRLDDVLTRAAADPAPFALDVGDGVRVEVRGGVVRARESAGPAARRRDT